MWLALPDPTVLTGIGARVLIAGYLVTMMFSTGLELGGHPKEDKATKRRQRHLLLRGLAINVLVMPLVAFGIIRLVHASGDAAVALVILGAAPGGRFAPHLSRLAGGELGLATEITLFLAKLTAFTAPPTTRLLVGGGHVHLHDLTIIAALVFLQLAPYLAGKQLRQRRPTFATRLARPVDVLSLVWIVAIVAFLVAHHQLRSVLLLGTSGWLAVIVLAVSSLAIGWLLGGPTAATRRAFAISANARNLALALMVASFAFSDRNVELVLFAQWLVLLVLSAAFALLARRRHGEVVGTPPTVGLGFEG